MFYKSKCQYNWYLMLAIRLKQSTFYIMIYIPRRADEEDQQCKEEQHGREEGGAKYAQAKLEEYECIHGPRIISWFTGKNKLVNLLN